MSGDAELLNFIYQNSQMGVDTIRQLIGVVEDKDLKEHLKTQFQGYEEFHQAAKELLNEHGYDEKGLGIMEKATHVFYDKPADYDGSVRLTHCQHADYRKQHGHRRGNPEVPPV